MGTEVASNTYTSWQFVHMFRSAVNACVYTSFDFTPSAATSASIALFLRIRSTVSSNSEYSRSSFAPFSCRGTLSGKRPMPWDAMLRQSS